MYLIPCHHCHVKLLIAEADLGRAVPCDWCRKWTVGHGTAGEATTKQLLTHLRQRGRSHATTLVGMAASNGLLVLLMGSSPDLWKTFLATWDQPFTLFIFATAVIHLLAGGVMVLAAVALQRGRQWGWCVTATVLTMLPGCCILFPFGILSGVPVLRFLLRRDVRRLYALNAPDGDPDAE